MYLYICIYVYVYIHMYVCVRVSACVFQWVKMIKFRFPLTAAAGKVRNQDWARHGGAIERGIHRFPICSLSHMLHGAGAFTYKTG